MKPTTEESPNKECLVKEILNKGDHLTAEELKQELRKKDISFVKSYDHRLSIIFYIIKVEDNINIKKGGDEYRQFMRDVPAINFVKGLWNMRKR